MGNGAWVSCPLGRCFILVRSLGTYPRDNPGIVLGRFARGRSPVTPVRVAATVSTIAFEDILVEEWNAFKAFHGKAYSSPVEEEFRKQGGQFAHARAITLQECAGGVHLLEDMFKKFVSGEELACRPNYGESLCC